MKFQPHEVLEFGRLTLCSDENNDLTENGGLGEVLEHDSNRCKGFPRWIHFVLPTLVQLVRSAASPVQHHGEFRQACDENENECGQFRKERCSAS